VVVTVRVKLEVGNESEDQKAAPHIDGTSFLQRQHPPRQLGL
jgi:hypothetical protein